MIIVIIEKKNAIELSSDESYAVAYNYNDIKLDVIFSCKNLQTVNMQKNSTRFSVWEGWIFPLPFNDTSYSFAKNRKYLCHKDSQNSYNACYPKPFFLLTPAFFGQKSWKIIENKCFLKLYNMFLWFDL